MSFCKLKVIFYSVAIGCLLSGRDGRCPRCRSQVVMAGVDVEDRSQHWEQPLRVRIQEPEPPNHGFIWRQVETYGTVRAWICAACGYTEFYTDNLQALYESYRKNHF